MSVSKIQICNRALSLIGQGSINDLEEKSVEARGCKLRYDSVRDDILREYPWSFATGSVALALTPVTFPGWSYAYMYPSNALTVQRIFDANDALNLNNKVQSAIRTDGQNKYIVCNLPNAWADITYKITDENLFDSQFTNVLAYRLAIQLVVPLTGNDSRKNALYQEYQAVLRSAQLTSAAENNFNPTLPNSYVNARR